MHQWSSLNEIAYQKAELRAEATRIRREMDLYAKQVQSVTELAQLGIDVVKQLRRPDITAPTAFGILTACSVLHKIQPVGFWKMIFTSGRMLLRVLPGLNAHRRFQQNDAEAAG